MKFKTRKEARDFCRDSLIPFSKISKDVRPDGYNWVITSVFVVGQKYRLVDADGLSAMGTAHRLQAKQIMEHLGGVVTIAKKYDDGHVSFEPHAKTSFVKLHQKEIKYFHLVDEDAPAVDVAVEEPQVDAGAVSVSVTVESSVFEHGKRYELTDRKGFFSGSSANAAIANLVDSDHDGIYHVKEVSPGRFFLHSEFGIPLKLRSYSAELLARERKFFTEIREVDAPSANVVVPDAVKLREAIAKLTFLNGEVASVTSEIEQLSQLVAEGK